MPLVNTASTRRAVTGANASPSGKNCAACTAAGCVNLAASYARATAGAPFELITTGDVAKAMGREDGQQTMGSNVDEQAAAIARFVKDKTNRLPRRGGSMSKSLPYSKALEFMKLFPDGTVYAVQVTGEHGHHWLNALKAGGTIRYFDFQVNRELPGWVPGTKNPASSRVPIVGTITQLSMGSKSETMHQTNQPGAYDTSRADCLVIAFAPIGWRP